MSESKLTLTGPKDSLPQLEVPTSQGTHPQVMPSQMGNRPGTVGATTHFRVTHQQVMPSQMDNTLGTIGATTHFRCTHPQVMPSQMGNRPGTVGATTHFRCTHAQVMPSQMDNTLETIGATTHFRCIHPQVMPSQMGNRPGTVGATTHFRCTHAQVMPSQMDNTLETIGATTHFRCTHPQVMPSQMGDRPETVGATTHFRGTHPQVMPSQMDNTLGTIGATTHFCGTHPQVMPSQMGNRPGTVGATTHFRTRAYSGSHNRNVYERPAPRDFRPEWMRAAALPNAVPPRLREGILEGGSTFWSEEGAPSLVEQWIRDSNFDNGSDVAVEVADDAKSNDTFELDSTIDLTDEGVGSISHSGATDENEKSNKSNSAMEKSDEIWDRKNVNEPSDGYGIHDNAAGESATDGNPVASSERKADKNNDPNLFDVDLDSSNTAWPAHDDVKDSKSGRDCYPVDEDDESIKTSNTPWPIYKDDERLRNNNNSWSIDENRVVTTSNTLWPIEEDARSNTSWSDEVRSSNTPWMSAEEEGGDAAPDMDTSFSSYSTALSQNIKVEVEDDRYRYCFYLSDMTSGKYGDQDLTFNQWLEIKARERAQPGSGYNLENIPVRGAEANASSNSTLPSVMGDMLHKR